MSTGNKLVNLDALKAVNDAMQGQVNGLKSAINELPFVEKYESKAITWTRTDKYISYNGTETSVNYYYQCVFDVTEGETYILTGTNDYGKAIYATLNSDSEPVRHPRTGNNNNLVSDIEIVIAENETKLVLQASANDRTKYVLKKVIGMALNADTVGLDNLKDEVTATFPTGEFVNLYNPNDPEVATGKIIKRDGSLTDSDLFDASGYIPIEQNVEYAFRVWGNYFGTGTGTDSVIYVPYYKADKTYHSFTTGTYDSENQTVKVTFTNANAFYTRINVAKIGTYVVNSIGHNPENMVFCKTPFPNEYIPYGEQYYFGANVYPDEANEQRNNPLWRKVVRFLGDSICNGASANDKKNGWAGRIGRHNQMLWHNAGISGATLTAGISGSAGVISETELGSANCIDYIIIEGGTNDADLIGNALSVLPAAFGSYDMGDFTSTFENTTYCGAIEYLFKKLLSDYKSCKFGVIIAPKMGQLNATYTDYTTEHNNRRFYFETLIKLCKKWGIQYLNLWDDCHLNPMIPAQYTSGQTYMYTDGQHLTSDGYDYVTPLIENWMKTL